MRTRPVRRSTIALVAMIVLGLVLAGTGLVFSSTANAGQGDEADRFQVVTRANDFAVAYNSYDVADLTDYQKRISGLLTSKYDKQFVEVTNAIFGALKDKKQRSSDAVVKGVAIESIDDDSASAIVAVDAAISNTDTPAAVQRHFRWKLNFDKTDGKWLVSNFESVASAEATTQPAATENKDGDAK